MSEALPRTDPGTEGPLSFYDEDRQRYGRLLSCDAAEAKFMIGDYGPAGKKRGVGRGGEFAVLLIRFASLGGLHPQLSVFGDATGSLLAAIDAGLLDCLDAVESRDEFSRRLMGIGLADRSDAPIA